MTATFIFSKLKQERIRRVLDARANVGKISIPSNLSRRQIDFTSSPAPLSVLPEFQGKGIGGMLVREGHRRAAELKDGGLDGIHGMVQYPDAFISAGDM